MNKTHLGLQRKERGIGGPTAQLEEENEEQKERERGWDLGGPIDSLLWKGTRHQLVSEDFLGQFQKTKTSHRKWYLSSYATSLKTQ